MGVNKTFTVNVCPEESPVPLSSRNSGGGGGVRGRGGFEFGCCYWALR